MRVARRAERDAQGGGRDSSLDVPLSLLERIGPLARVGRCAGSGVPEDPFAFSVKFQVQVPYGVGNRRERRRWLRCGS